MSRFRHALKDRDQHILTLRVFSGVLCGLLLMVTIGWMTAPDRLTIHNRRTAFRQYASVVGSSSVNGLFLCVLHFSATECLAEKWRGGLSGENTCTVGLSDTVMPGDPGDGCPSS